MAEFHTDSIHHLNDAPTRGLIDSLLAGSEAFPHYWASQTVVEREGGERAFMRPRDGHLVYQQTTLKPVHREDLKFMVLIPDAPSVPAMGPRVPSNARIRIC